MVSGGDGGDDDDEDVQRLVKRMKMKTKGG